jgi:hypothetical protein
MIPGFLEGLNLMSYGDKVVLFIPSNLAYETRAGGVIPPNATDFFDGNARKPTGQNNKKILLKLRLIKETRYIKNISGFFIKLKFFISYWSLNKMYCAISCYLSIEKFNPETSGLED